jgi:hypothetical protein
VKDLLEEIPADNTSSLRSFLNKNFPQDPQLLGGNHTTEACKMIVRKHTRENENGEKEYHKYVESTTITEDLLPKFSHRQCHYLICPLPLEQAKKYPRIRMGLLVLAKQFNDHAKTVKRAYFYDQLVKARGALEVVLRNSTNPGTHTKEFKPDQSVWPESHADLERGVYSRPGVAAAVKNAISVEFATAHSHIKVLVTCPQEVFDLLMKITTVKTFNKELRANVPIVNSAKNLQPFTLQFCKKEDLLLKLQRVLENVQAVGQKKISLNKLADQHKSDVNLTKMLNNIATDLKTGATRNVKFENNIGPLSEEGFYTEDNFKQV